MRCPPSFTFKFAVKLDTVCDISSELRCSGAKPRRWTPLLVTRLGVLLRVCRRFHFDFFVFFFACLNDGTHLKTNLQVRDKISDVKYKEDFIDNVGLCWCLPDEKVFQHARKVLDLYSDVSRKLG